MGLYFNRRKAFRGAPTSIYAATTALLNGSSQSYTIGNGATFDGYTSFAMEIYFKADTLHTGRIFDKWAASAQSYIFRLNAAGDMTFFVSDTGTNSTTVTSDTTLSVQTWYHAVANYTGSNIEIYINGSLDCTPVSYSGTIHDNATVAYLGAGGTQAVQYFDGSIAFARFYDSSLTSGQISSLYNGGDGLCYDELENKISGITTNLVSCWHLADFTGHTTDEETDQHGSNNLTNNNSVTYVATGLNVECPSTFSPSDLSGLEFWIDGDTGYSDKSGNAHTVTNSGTSIISGTNGHSTFDFNTGDYIATDRLLTNDDFTFFVVAKDTGTNANGAIYTQHTGAASTGRTVIGTDDTTGNKLKYFYNNGSSHNNTSLTTMLDGSYHIGVITDNNGTSYANIDSGSNETLTTSQPYTPLNTNGRFGQVQDGGAQFFGEMQECIIYTPALSDTDKDQVITYLQDKYAL